MRIPDGRRPSARMTGIGIALCLAASLTGAEAQDASTPIQGPQDAARRNEARARVFSTPDPRGLGLYAVGKQIYMACMKRSQSGTRRAKARAS